MDKESKPITLLVEDDDVDAMAIQRAIGRKNFATELIRAKDGVEALEHMRGENGKQALNKPYVLLLDLNMPRMNGIELLAELRDDPKLEDNVVFVLTTSAAEADQEAAYQHNIAGYIVKSDLKENYQEVVALLESYWKVVSLPGHPH